ncbi:MAG: hypothetical protein N2Z72_06890 [Bacteroidales bacterium]|nr:hypothetical protein [Bacteroidales bacterium]
MNWKEVVDSYEIFNEPVRLLDYRILEGANYFSHRPVVLLEIDLGDYDEVFTHQIIGFFEKLTSLIPSLEEHYCSEGKRGGFYVRLQEGTLLGHVIEHVAIELQSLAGLPVTFGKTRSTLRQGVYTVIYEFKDEIFGILAGKGALNIINSILTGKNFDLEKFIDYLKDIKERRWLGPTTESIVAEAENRGIPWFRLDEFNFIQLGTGKFSKRLRASMTENISVLTVDIIKDRLTTLKLLSQHALPVMKYDEKPFSGKSYIVTTRFREKERVQFYLERDYLEIMENDWIYLQTTSPIIYRFLVIGDQVASIVKMIPPFVEGNGVQNIRELFLQKLGKELEGNSLLRVNFQLQLNHFSLETVLEKGERCWLDGKVSSDLGGIIAAQSNVHHEWKAIAVQAAKVLRMDVAGIDIYAKNIEEEPSGFDGIYQIVASPDFRKHLYPDEGNGRNVARILLDYLYPSIMPVCVPLVAVGGSDQQARFIQLIYPLLQSYYSHIAFYDGYSLQAGNRIFKAYPRQNSENIKLLLQDPNADFILAKVPDELIVYKGLPYAFAEVGIVLNTYPEFASKFGFHRASDYAYAQGVVLEQVSDDGFIIVNSRNPYIGDLLSQACKQRVFFSAEYLTSDQRQLGNYYLMVDKEKLIWVDKDGYYDKICSLKNFPGEWFDQHKNLHDYVLGALAFCIAYEKKCPGLIRKMFDYYGI